MRTAFIQALIEVAEEIPNIVLLTADLGYRVLEGFADAFPERFFNVGVAEQDMTGIATGLAEAGYIPFVYSIASFAVLRPYEFIRNGPALHKLPVRIVGVGGGVDYGHNGISHYGIEDIGVTRVQPNLTVIAPADEEQARNALRSTAQLSGPIYFRLGKDGSPAVSGLKGRFALGKVQVVREGNDLLILTLGPVANEAVAAATELAKQGIECTIAVVACLNPPPTAALAELLGKFRSAITVEAHYIVGGLGSLVAEVIAEKGIPCRLIRCGLKTMPVGITGSQNYLYDQFGISSKSLVQTAQRCFQVVSNER